MVSISILLTVIICGFIFFKLAKEETDQNVGHKRSRLLYCSNNRNSYQKASEIFAVIEDAGIKLNYLGVQDE